MQFITAFARAVTTTNLWVARVMRYVVFVLFALLLSDVLMRKLVGSPMQWSTDAAKLLFGVYAILGGGYLLARREHVNVDLFYAAFSRRKKAIVDIVTSFLFFLLLGVLLKESWSIASDSVARWEVSYLTTWQAPLWPSKCLMVVAALLLLLQGVVKLIADVMILVGIEVDESAYGPIDEGEDGKQDTV